MPHRLHRAGHDGIRQAYHLPYAQAQAVPGCHAYRGHHHGHHYHRPNIIGRLWDNLTFNPFPNRFCRPPIVTPIIVPPVHDSILVHDSIGYRSSSRIASMLTAIFLTVIVGSVLIAAAPEAVIPFLIISSLIAGISFTAVRLSPSSWS